MTAPARDIVLTGASGAIGQEFLARALALWPGCRIICLLRSDEAMATARRIAGERAGRLRLVKADLTDPASMAAAAAEIGRFGSIVGVHAAADVSWERGADEMAALNVAGTLHFAELLRRISDAPRMIYLSTAYTQAQDWAYRNGYETTKAEAERRLAAECGDIAVSTFACSLVVGDSAEGRIGRYNGIYPILRFLAEFGPPFLVGKKTAMLDIVPVDWVARELALLTAEQMSGLPPRDIVAAAGRDRKIAFERVVRIGEAGIAAFDDRHGLPRAEPVPILRSRQWAFLKRSLKAWQPPELSVGDFRYFERLLQVYGVYSESDTVRDAHGIAEPAPLPERFLPVVVERWIADHADRLVARRGKLARATAARAAKATAQTDA